MSKDRRNVVVVGSGGRLGSALVKLLEPDHQVLGLDRSQLNLGSIRSINAALEKLDYDQIILTGSLTAVDYCETHVDEAFAVNADGAARIAEISATKGAHMTYISTDMVFDGTKEEPYVESDQPNPISVYGASKLAGETRVVEVSKSNLVLRISWLFGPGRPAFPEWVIDKACCQSDLTLPGDKIACPTYTLDLIRWLTSLVLERSDGPAAGVFHLCNSSPCAWREWGQFCIDTARAAGFPVMTGEIVGVPVASVPAFVAKRPLNSAMSTDKFSSLVGTRPRDWSEALRDFVRQSDSFAKYRLAQQVR
ncbi:MAG: NAD(P)-dependent oxidoreductase [Verrucomicrobiota bacterium]